MAQVTVGGRHQHALAQIGPCHHGFCQYGVAQGCAAQVDGGHSRTGQVGFREVGTEQIRSAKISPAHYAGPEMSAGQVGLGQDTAREVHPGKVNELQTGPLPARAAAEKQPVRLEDAAESILAKPAQPYFLA
ncbi:MAG: hypothetical protein U1E70_26605 [Acetobacteraceae bacterium]